MAIDENAFLNITILVVNFQNMIKFWFRYNWHWLSAAIVFSTSVLIVAIATSFNPKWAYNTVNYIVGCRMILG
jgi:hypothetical protein